MLFRRTFAIPPGAIAAATLSSVADNAVTEVYVNGVAVADGVGVDVAAALIPGATNVLAFLASNVAFEAWLSYRLDINGGTP